MNEVAFLALALSMDSFAVSISLGVKQQKKIFSLAFIAGIYFGIFQAMMPIIGYTVGKETLTWLSDTAPWIAFFLLLFIGGKMLFESFCLLDKEEISLKKVSHKMMIILALATSIDALVGGFTLNLLPVNPYLSCAIIGLTTFLFSGIGVLIGKKCGIFLERKAVFLGGIILILLGVKIIIY